ncbi:MAG: RNA polymerase sigma factor, partial [Planctomycetota bacterium]
MSDNCTDPPAGDPGERIRAILDEYERPLLRYAQRITLDLERARDVVQETFLTLVSKPPDEGNHMAQWLFTVCRNRALDVVRKEQRMKPLTDDHARSQASPEPAPHEAAEGAEAAGHVSAAMADLPANQQDVLRLKFQSGFSYRQIAAITGLSVSNVGFL